MKYLTSFWLSLLIAIVIAVIVVLVNPTKDEVQVTKTVQPQKK
jgi:hypothetical protein